jgi:hypothetical protein
MPFALLPAKFMSEAAAGMEEFMKRLTIAVEQQQRRQGESSEQRDEHD